MPNDPHQTGKAHAITGVAPLQSSVPRLMTLTDRQILAAKAARELFDLLPPQDVTNPRMFMAAVVETLSNYHQSVITSAPIAIAKRTNRLTLKVVTDVCDELQDPIARKFERDRAAASHWLGLISPAKPDQERRDKQVADYEERVKPQIVEALKPMPRATVTSSRDDGRHAARIAADLAARKARNQPQENATGPPDTS